MMSLRLLIPSLVLFFTSVSQVSAQEGQASSEAIDGRKGMFRLHSAENFDPGSYHFRSSLQYTNNDNFLKNNRNIESMKAQLGVGYSVFKNFHLAAHVGLESASQEVGVLRQSYNLARYGAAATYSDDIGARLGFGEDFWVAGASLWMDFSKITRFFKGPNFRPSLISSFDFTHSYGIPLKLHQNIGFQSKNNKRFFDASGDPTDSGIIDFDRYATRSLNAHALTLGLGAEMPFEYASPLVEFHMEYVSKVGLSRSPKWVTVGTKSRPLPQKNIELFAALDLNLASFRATPTSEVPTVYGLPTWNLLVGFGLSQFGRRAGEINVDAQEYEQTRSQLQSRESTLSQLRRDLSYNTIQGRVIHAETKEALPDVTISFPDQERVRPIRTDSDGEFLRYFPSFTGRIQFSAEGFETATQFYNLKPGEAITANVELRRATAVNTGDFVVSLMNEAGEGVEAQIVMLEMESREETRVQTDSSGRVSVKLASGTYRVMISAEGYETIRDQIQVEAGRAVLRAYTFNATQEAE